jgi:hypothetical protein
MVSASWLRRSEVLNLRGVDEGQAPRDAISQSRGLLGLGAPVFAEPPVP